MSTIIRKISDFVPASLAGTPAERVVAKATVQFRHADRVAATREAAIEWGSARSDKISEETECHVSTEMCALSALLADRYGFGGSTTRHEAFRDLGKGRKHASDGGAYMAAAWEVLFSGGEFTPHIADRWGEISIWFCTDEDFQRCFQFEAGEVKPRPCPADAPPDWHPAVAVDAWSLVQACPAEATAVASEILKKVCGPPEDRTFQASVEDAGRFFNAVVHYTALKEQE